MIVYEVNLFVREAIAADFRVWRDAHVREIVALPGFRGADVSERHEPAAANKSLNRRIGHARDVLRQNDSEKPVIDAMFNVLPQTLLVMMPIFALMLKLAYVFKRRLYMEHLIVALHSHSFIALAVILIMGESFLIGLVPAGGFVADVLNWIRGLTIAWIPLYLLLMQKRVYGQGWPMTLAKYGVLGLCYSILLSIAMAASILVGLLTL